MTTFFLVQFNPYFFSKAPNIVLRQKSVKVRTFDETVTQLGNGILKLLDDLGYGIGLGAPQVGVLQRVIVLNVTSPRSRYSIKPKKPEEEASFQPVRAVFVNPEITYRSSETELDYEGSLSLPGFAGLVKRAVHVEIQAQDMNGNRLSFIAKDLVARVIQHEMDYLEGILYTDRMPQGEELVGLEDLNSQRVK
ncbi:MAG: hypothetical protein C0410_06625 [Anaerolinea sp.]|nr:hypothetical protein [Anaerolinea sp.]